MDKTTAFLMGLSKPLEAIVGKLEEQKLAYDSQNQIRTYYNKLNEEMSNITSQMQGLDTAIPEQKTNYDMLNTKLSQITSAVDELKNNDVTNLILTTDKPFKSRQEMKTAFALLPNKSQQTQKQYKPVFKKTATATFDKLTESQKQIALKEYGTNASKFAFNIWEDFATGDTRLRSVEDQTSLSIMKYYNSLKESDEQLRLSALKEARQRASQKISMIQKFIPNVDVQLDQLNSPEALQRLIDQTSELQGEAKIQVEKVLNEIFADAENIYNTAKKGFDKKTTPPKDNKKQVEGF